MDKPLPWPTMIAVNRPPWLLIIVSSIAALALVLSGWLFYQNRQLTKQLASLQTPGPLPINPTPNPTPTPDPTAGWKTCTNLKNGYSIKYPPNFDVATDDCNYAIADYNLVRNVDASIPEGDFQKNWLLSIIKENSNLPIDQWIKNKNLCPEEFKSCSDKTTGPIKDSVQFNSINRHYSGTNTILKTGGAIFAFSLDARNPDTPVNASIRRIYEQILSTFKFLD